MYRFIGFLVIFTIGGMAGLLHAAPPADFQIHNTLFLVAHFHTMIIGVALFGIFAGTTYWFPKIWGFTLDERLGKIAFWFWLSGYFVAFIPIYLLGFMGAARRLDHYSASTGWQPLFITALIGFSLFTCGILVQIYQLIYSIKEREESRYDRRSLGRKDARVGHDIPPTLLQFCRDSSSGKPGGVLGYEKTRRSTSHTL